MSLFLRNGETLANEELSSRLELLREELKGIIAADPSRIPILASFTKDLQDYITIANISETASRAATHDATSQRSSGSSSSAIPARTMPTESTAGSAIERSIPQRKILPTRRATRSAGPVTPVVHSSRRSSSASNQQKRSTQVRKSCRQPMRTLDATGSEWEEFGQLYRSARETNLEGLGAVLVNLPGPIREAALVREVHHFSGYGIRMQIDRLPNGLIEIRTLDEGATRIGDSFQFRLDHSLDPSQVAATAPLADLVHSFEGTASTNRSPIYAVEKDVDSPSHRIFYGLPSLSAIFPLRGNSLESTAVGFAGIHTPWMYVSEGFGTCFSLQREDFDLVSLNVLLAGAPKVWTVIEPAESSKVEKFLTKESGYTASCFQFVRHLGLYIPTAKLDELEIRYTQFEQQVGQVVITFPGAYHQGFNAGPNISEAVNFADSSFFDAVRETGYISCTKKGCGYVSAAMSNLLPLALGSAQRLVGINKPQQIEALITKAAPPRKRPRITAEASSKADSYLVEQDADDYTSKIRERQDIRSNLDRDGEPIIALVKLFSSLSKREVQIDRVSRKVSHYYAAILSCIVMDCGSPVVFQDLSIALQALRSQTLLPKKTLDSSDHVANVVNRVRSLDSLEAAHLIANIATRYNLAYLARDFDSMTGSSSKAIDEAYTRVLSTLNPMLVGNPGAFKRQQEKLRYRMGCGRRWQKLVSRFGISVLALISEDIPFGGCNALIHSMPQGIFDLFLGTMQVEQGEWITQVGEQLGQYVLGRLDSMEEGDAGRLPLEIANPPLLAEMKYRARDLLGLCIIHP